MLSLKQYVYPALVAVGLFVGWTANGWRHDSLELMAQKAADKTAVVAAKAISKIEVRNVTIRQEAQKEIQTNTVYSDCRVSPDMFRMLNDAIQDRSSGDGGVSGSGAVSGRVDGGVGSQDH